VAGTLVHGRGFRKKRFTAPDGSTHHELEPVDGDTMDFCNTTWGEQVLRPLIAIGVAEELIPTFATGEPYDQDPRRIARRCDELRRLLPMIEARIPEGGRGDALVYVLDVLRRGDIFFFQR
jgi:hypothetical protein